MLELLLAGQLMIPTQSLCVPTPLMQGVSCTAAVSPPVSGSCSPSPRYVLACTMVMSCLYSKHYTDYAATPSLRLVPKACLVEVAL